MKLLALSLLGLNLGVLYAQQPVRVSISHQWGEDAVDFDRAHKTNEGMQVRMERLSYLISELRFRKVDGDWLELKDKVWFVDAQAIDGSAVIIDRGELPEGAYDKLSMTLGLNEELDASDPNQYPQNHALNPVLNQLHWSWSGGYIYLALEGLYEGLGKKSGFSYHLARQSNRVELEFDIDLSSDKAKMIELNWDVSVCFNGSGEAQLGVMPDTTHSAKGDVWAGRIKDSVKSGWSLKNISEYQLEKVASEKAEYRPYGTPYPIRIKPWMPKVSLPERNFPSYEGVRLGEELFFDERLSSGSMSCASCHNHEMAFTDNGKSLSMGVKGEFGTRNSMPIANLLWSSEFFWDGHASSLREQALMPIENEVEMNETLENVVQKLSSDKVVTAMFEKAFGSPEVTSEKIGLALEQFMVTIIAQESKFDLAMSGAGESLTADEQRGMELFFTESDPRRGQHGADCFHCHGGGLFTNQAYMDNGLDLKYQDLGRFLVTNRERDKGRFKVPSLRNVELTSPYMHDGRFETLEEVVDHYSDGVKRSPNLDPNLAKHQGRGLNLSDEDKACLVAFLKSLTDVRYRK